MKNHTGPKPPITVDADVPWVWADLAHVLREASVRVSGTAKKNPSWGNRDVKAVRRAVRACIKRQRLAPGNSYAIPLWDVLRELNNQHIFDRSVLVNALNIEGSGLELVRPRRLAFAS